MKIFLRLLLNSLKNRKVSLSLSYLRHKNLIVTAAMSPHVTVYYCAYYEM